jgi:hypothetical protein
VQTGLSIPTSLHLLTDCRDHTLTTLARATLARTSDILRHP